MSVSVLNKTDKYCILLSLTLVFFSLIRQQLLNCSEPKDDTSLFQIAIYQRNSYPLPRDSRKKKLNYPWGGQNFPCMSSSIPSLIFRQYRYLCSFSLVVQISFVSYGGLSGVKQGVVLDLSK